MTKKFTRLLLLMILLSTGLNAQVWESVGNSSGISDYIAGRLNIVSDLENNPIVGYYDLNAEKGSVQKFSNGAWKYVGGHAGISEGFAAYNTTSVDSEGNIYFLNQSFLDNYGIEARKFSGNSWTTMPNPSSVIINNIASAVSSDNTLYIASNENGGIIRKFKNGVWQQVGNSGFFAGGALYLDMAISTDGKIYVSFNNNGYVHLYVNEINATSSDSWQPVGGQHNLFPAESSDNYSSSIVLDSSNILYLAYVSQESSGRKLNVSKYDGSSFVQLGPSNFSPNPVQYVSIGANNNNVYVVSSLSDSDSPDHFKNSVMVYDSSENNWKNVGTGFISSGQATYNSLVVSPNGSVYVAYNDSALEKLVVKRLNNNILAPQSVTVKTQNNVPFEINIDKGTLQLEATVQPSSTDQNVIWNIEEGSTFATVDQNGLLKAIASNTIVKVKAASAVNPAISASVYVSLKNQDSDIPAESIKILTANGFSPDIQSIGNKVQLKAVVLPLEADQEVTWQVIEGNNNIYIDQNGLVEGLQDGYGIVKATHKDGSISSTIRINVFQNGCSQGTTTNLFGLGMDITKNQSKAADDFIVPENTRLTIKNLRFSVLTNYEDVITKVKLNFLKNDNGHPGAIITSTMEITPTSQTLVNASLGAGGDLYEYEISLDLNENIYFDEGTYWISPEATSQNSENIFWNISTNDTLGNFFHVNRNDGNGWVKFDINGGFNAVYHLSGNCVPMPVKISTVDGGTANLLIGQTLALKATSNGNPLNEISWAIESGDSGTINSTGVVTGVKEGKIIIKASLINSPQTFGLFEVTVLDPNACKKEVISNDLEDGFVFAGDSNQRLAVDIDVPSGSNFTINSVQPTVINYATSFKFTFYKDNNGLPGEIINTQNGSIDHDEVTGLNFEYYFHRYNVKLDSPLTFTEGKYWMEIESDALGWESTTLGPLGLAGAALNDNNSEWHLIEGENEFVYSLNGICISDELSTNENFSKTGLTYYPNPVNDDLSVYANKNIVSIEVFNFAGQKAISKTFNSKDTRLDVSKLLPGVYIVNARLMDGTTKTFKIIKK
jgi:Bacterial Ig-like domain (group 2).